MKRLQEALLQAAGEKHSGKPSCFTTVKEEAKTNATAWELSFSHLLLQQPSTEGEGGGRRDALSGHQSQWVAVNAQQHRRKGGKYCHVSKQNSCLSNCGIFSQQEPSAQYDVTLDACRQQETGRDLRDVLTSPCPQIQTYFTRLMYVLHLWCI